MRLIVEFDSDAPPPSQSMRAVAAIKPHPGALSMALEQVGEYWGKQQLVPTEDHTRADRWLVIDETAMLEQGLTESTVWPIALAELSAHNDWLRGEVYRFQSVDPHGTILDECGEFYDIQEATQLGLDMLKHLTKTLDNEFAGC